MTVKNVKIILLALTVSSLSIYPQIMIAVLRIVAIAMLRIILLSEPGNVLIARQDIFLL
jgi:hypothetical protein